MSLRVAMRGQLAAEITIDDFYTKGGRLRENGRVIRPFYLVQVKTPAGSKYKFDYYKILSTIAPEQGVRPLSESECSLVRK